MQTQERISADIVEAVKELVYINVKHIVDNPDDVRVVVPPSEGYQMTVALHTNPRDVGQVIGKKGHVVSSIRSLLSALSGKHDINIVFDFVTDQDNKRQKKMNKRKMN